MSAVPKNVVELRRVLAEKFPGVRMTAEPQARLSNRWATGIEPLDAVLGGGLAKSAVTEIVSPGIAGGSASLIAWLVERARHEGHWLALIDATNSFDAAALNNELLRRVLWLRCASAREAVKAADLVLHDGTAAVAVLDLTLCPAQALRRIPSSIWFRLERLVENTSTALLVMTPSPLVSTAEIRLQLERRFTLEALGQRPETLASRLSFQPVKASLRIAGTG